MKTPAFHLQDLYYTLKRENNMSYIRYNSNNSDWTSISQEKNCRLFYVLNKKVNTQASNPKPTSQSETQPLNKINLKRIAQDSLAHFATKRRRGNM